MFTSNTLSNVAFFYCGCHPHGCINSSRSGLNDSHLQHLLFRWEHILHHNLDLNLQCPNRTEGPNLFLKKSILPCMPSPTSYLQFPSDLKRSTIKKPIWLSRISRWVLPWKNHTCWNNLRFLRHFFRFVRHAWSAAAWQTAKISRFQDNERWCVEEKWRSMVG